MRCPSRPEVSPEFLQENPAGVRMWCPRSLGAEVDFHLPRRCILSFSPFWHLAHTGWWAGVWPRGSGHGESPPQNREKM